MGLPVTVTTAHPVHQVSDPAASRTGWQWLHCAAEMAAVASGSSVLSPAMPLPPAPSGWTAFPRVAMRTPGIDPSSVSAARRFTTLTMQRWGVADRGPDVAIVVSELLSNALRHGLPPLDSGRPDRPIRLGLVHSGPSVMCAVADPSDQLPVPRHADILDESGRGLHVIASLCDQWGSCMARGRPGKVVWATFRMAPHAEALPPRRQTGL
jgi:anti-sigma regulatory factor (Ser/Thr protein kinase)